jgi:hypothetical protein
MLAALIERDNPFPEIDYRSFAARQGKSSEVFLTDAQGKA